MNTAEKNTVRPKVHLFKKFLAQNYSSAIMASVALFLVFSIFTDSFLTPYNMFNLARNISLYAFVAIGQAMVVVIGGMNLSVGAVGGLSVVTVGVFIQELGMPPIVAVIAALIVGLLAGALNGFLVVKLRLSAFVITLATSFIFTGLVYGISEGFPYTDIPESFTTVGRGSFLGIPILFWMTIILLVIMYVMFRFTRVGRNILATGGNKAAAELSGINTNRITMLCNMLSAMFAAIAGMLWVSRMGTASPATGADWMIYSFAVSAIGGIALTGGVFTSVGFFCGSVIISIIKNGLTMLNVNVYFEQTFLGIIILLAVAVESIRSRYVSTGMQTIRTKQKKGGSVS